MTWPNGKRVRSTLHVRCKEIPQNVHLRNRGRGRISLHYPKDRLGDLVLESVLSEAHAVFGIWQETKTLFLEAWQSRRPTQKESRDTRREIHCTRNASTLKQKSYMSTCTRLFGRQLRPFWVFVRVTTFVRKKARQERACALPRGRGMYIHTLQ